MYVCMHVRYMLATWLHLLSLFQDPGRKKTRGNQRPFSVKYLFGEAKIA